MFRQSGNSAAPASRSGELLTTSSGGGVSADVNLVEVGGAAISLGQKTEANSLPVVIASDQSAIPITGSITATNPSVDATGGAVPADATYVGINVGGTLTGAVAGHGTAAGALRVELPTDGTGVIATVGAVTAITNALPAGTNVIGHVIADTGSTTAVTGNVTVIQGTATNLKTQAEAYQGGVAVGAAAPLQVSVANTGANGTAIKVDGTGGSFPISGTVTANQGTSPWIVAGGGTAGTAATGVVTVQGIASMTKLLVTPDANSAVNVAQVGGTNSVTAGVNGTLAVGGNVATNVAIGTNPINLGAQGVSSENSAITTGRMVQLVADLVGKLIVLPYANPENFVSGTITSAMSGTTSTSLIAAPAGSLRNYITQITVSNASTTVPTDILIQDGSGGTTIYVVPAPAGTGTGTGAGGATLTFPTPLRQPTAATALYAQNVTTGSSTKISASGYKGL